MDKHSIELLRVQLSHDSIRWELQLCALTLGALRLEHLHIMDRAEAILYGLASCKHPGGAEAGANDSAGLADRGASRWSLTGPEESCTREILRPAFMLQLRHRQASGMAWCMHSMPCAGFFELTETA